jgi:hypothetical protein
VRFCTGEDAKALGRSPKAKLWAATDERREHAEF